MGFYVLFEKSSAGSDNSIYNWDIMGAVASEKDAISWVSNNSEYRMYKYCSEIKTM